MIHPGYGFLSENAEFARACARAGIIFVGPKPELLEMMGDKVAARALAQKLKVPTLPGTEEAIADPDQALKVAHEIGFPLIIKAAFGGGGRGMRVVHKAERSRRRCSTRRRARPERAFGNARGLPREVHRAAPSTSRCRSSATSTATWCTCTSATARCSAGTRRSSRSRPAVGPRPTGARRALRRRRRASRSEIGYDNAGTVEFLYDLDTNEWFFIEMNPRIQVEHTVTEEITGIDLVRSQILIAQGHALHGRRSALPRAGRDSAQRLRDPVPRHDRGPGEQVHAGLRQDPHLPLAGRLRHPARRRHGRRRRGHHAVLRLAAGEDHRQRPAPSTSRWTAWTARCASSASAA